MSQTPPRRASKSEILEAFLANLRQRGNFDLDAPGVMDGIRQHFSELPTRYALDVNISTLDVLNHKRWGVSSTPVCTDRTVTFAGLVLCKLRCGAC